MWEKNAKIWVSTCTGGSPVQPDLIRLHFTSSYALYNYYVTNKETLNTVNPDK